MDRPFNKPGLSPEEFLRLVAHEDTLSQGLHRRATKHTPFVILRIHDPWCNEYVARFPALKEFITKDRVTKAPTLEVRVLNADPGRGNRKSQSCSSSGEYNSKPSSGGSGSSKIETTSIPLIPIPLSSTQGPLSAT